MTSVISTVAQIAPRVHFLLAVSDASGTRSVIPESDFDALITDYSAELIFANRSVVNTLDAATFIGHATTLAVSNTGTLYRDLGETVQVMTTGRSVYTYRLCQPVDGATTSGVPSDYPTANVYVCTWSADPATVAVSVARTG
jgi:hypothetical protein